MSFTENPSLGFAGIFLLLIDFLLYPGFDRMKHVPGIAIVLAISMILLNWRVIYPGYDDPWEMCVSADRVFDEGDYTCLFLSSFEHASFLHLFCNMASFVWTAACLEHKLHPLYFVYMVFVFALACNLAEIFIAEITTKYFHDQMARYACAIGFSDVLFALKILLVCYPATHEKWSQGFFLKYLPYPSLSLVTLEFALLHLFVPEASLQSHLAGVIVGLLYVAGPLSYPMNALWTKMTLGWGSCCGHLEDPLVYMLGMKVDEHGYIVKPGKEIEPWESHSNVVERLKVEQGDSDPASPDASSSEDEDSSKIKQKKKKSSKHMQRKNRKSLETFALAQNMKNRKDKGPISTRKEKRRGPPPPCFPPPEEPPMPVPSWKKTMNPYGIRPSVIPLTDLSGGHGRSVNGPKSSDSEELFVHHKKLQQRPKNPRSNSGLDATAAKSPFYFPNNPHISTPLRLVKSFLVGAKSSPNSRLRAYSVVHLVQ